MSHESHHCLTYNRDTLVKQMFRARDLNGSSAFQLSTSTWSLRKRSDGSIVESGSSVVNNSATDRWSNTIKTLLVEMDLRNTDPMDKGTYYLVIQLELTSGQTDFFRFPVEIVDYRDKDII